VYVVHITTFTEILHDPIHNIQFPGKYTVTQVYIVDKVENSFVK